MKIFSSFEICVRDVSRTVQLFVDIFEAQKEYEDSTFAVIWFGKSRIILNKLELSEFSAPNPILKAGATEHLGAGLEIVIAVENLSELHGKLQHADVQGLTDIVSREWGLKDFRFAISDGYYIRVTEPDAGVKEVW
ncbi:hypothetical protein EYC59_05085 [Candidatus Saccharibacteria bacterium]|nr:MAG: hypothetical protein EYC59_05085 [Candidatus Saccharibacteria bacterium]